MALSCSIGRRHVEGLQLILVQCVEPWPGLRFFLEVQVIPAGTVDMKEGLGNQLFVFWGLVAHVAYIVRQPQEPPYRAPKAALGIDPLPRPRIFA